MDGNDFQIVSFEKDRDKAFEDLLLKPVLVTGWQDSSRPIFFLAQGLDTTGLRLSIVDGDGLLGKAGESAEFLFSLDEGQYNWKTKILECVSDRWTVERGGELSRLQRRNNFRMAVPKGYKASLVLKTLKTLTITPTDLPLVDISASGARVQWPKAGLSPAAVGDSLSGSIALPGGRVVEIFGIVRSVLNDAETGQVQAGLEFQNVSGRDEQTLLHLCLQIRRYQPTVLR